ncbi:hypothetical protein Pyn_35012 [Prunus yedoensis var. nudiflora]|uniref:Uncharacterized protein n=1 Tax=Prunus yedoensis var. nudiflora TaxID=2094558 RepID=A0A314UXM5_PRUYE|nr:hypothetical protein Pyn_35012 [Prunus yedoensis var. nudiflora]
MISLVSNHVDVDFFLILLQVCFKFLRSYLNGSFSSSSGSQRSSKSEALSFVCIRKRAQIRVADKLQSSD